MLSQMSPMGWPTAIFAICAGKLWGGVQETEADDPNKTLGQSTRTPRQAPLAWLAPLSPSLPLATMHCRAGAEGGG